MTKPVEHTDEQKRAVEKAVKKSFGLWASTEPEATLETIKNGVQIIEMGGAPAFAIIPWQEYQALVANANLTDFHRQIPGKVIMATVRGGSLADQLQIRK